MGSMRREGSCGIRFQYRLAGGMTFQRSQTRDRPKSQNMKGLGEFFGLFGRHL